MTRARKAIGQATSGPFTVYAFSTIRTDAIVERDGQHFMTIADADGAKRLAAFLNDAVDLADDVVAMGCQTVESSRQRLAYAVAKALGETLDFAKSPTPLAARSALRPHDKGAAK